MHVCEVLCTKICMQGYKYTYTVISLYFSTSVAPAGCTLESCRPMHLSCSLSSPSRVCMR